MNNIITPEQSAFEHADFLKLQKKYSVIKKDFSEFTQADGKIIQEKELDEFVQQVMLTSEAWQIKDSISRDALVFIREVDEYVLQIVSIQMNILGLEFNRFPTPIIFNLRIKNKHESFDNLEVMVENFYFSPFFIGSRSAEGICSKELFDPKICSYTQKYYSMEKWLAMVKEMAYLCHHLSEVFSYAFWAIKSYLFSNEKMFIFTGSSFYNRDQDFYQINMLDNFSAAQRATVFELADYSTHLFFEIKKGRIRLNRSNADWSVNIQYHNNQFTNIIVTKESLKSTLPSLTHNNHSDLIVDMFSFFELKPAGGLFRSKNNTIGLTQFMRSRSLCMAWQHYD